MVDWAESAPVGLFRAPPVLKKSSPLEACVNDPRMTRAGTGVCTEAVVTLCVSRVWGERGRVSGRATLIPGLSCFFVIGGTYVTTRAEGKSSMTSIRQLCRVILITSRPALCRISSCDLVPAFAARRHNSSASRFS